ncbi:site-specific integrase [Gordonia oryzae]|uniref:Site-specific integrase n=1 Tax=Gordonia oryzae TaxID=2487349 RepID=A0A3N4GPP6_9ACTN|nr:site-specific integrase [Gordonia oryzae]RPA64889.1 site-specific integrase [Gordonia oryzae]
MKASIHARSRADGTTAYRVRWRADGKQVIQTFDALGAAEVFRHNVEKWGPAKAYELAGVSDVAESAGAYTVTDAAKHHVDHLTGIEPGTIAQYRRYIANDLGPLANLPLIAVEVTTISAWVQWLETERKNRGKTIANKHGWLFAVFARAVSEKRIPKNPCEGTKLPDMTPEDEPVFLTRAEFDLIHSTITPHWRPLTLWLVATGMRISEATALRVGDIDPRQKTARVSRAWKAKRGEARLGGPKSKAGRRTVDIPDRALAVIDLDRPADQWLFVNTVGSRVTYEAYYKRWYAARLKHKIACSPHDLRHTCASWMIAAGIPLPVIQQHLGHESILVTVGTYGHLDRSSKRAAAAAIGHVLS